MNVIAVAECQDRALRKSRSTLSRYLFQIGSRTWYGSLSSEGLNSLQEALKNIKDQDTAIAVYQASKQSSLKPLFYIGQSERFDESTSVFAHRTKAVLKRKKYPLMDLLIITIELAALLHDMGKSIIGFQKKLLRALYSHDNSQLMSDPVRHEVNSVLLCYWMFENREGSVWVTLLKEPDKLIASFKKSEKNLERLNLKGMKNAIRVIFTPYNLQCYPLLTALLWLILTHHRLPNNPEKWLDIVKGNSDISMLDQDLAAYFDTSHSKKAFQEFQKVQTPFWEKSTTWIDQCVSIGEKLENYSLFFNEGGMEKKQTDIWWRYVTTYGRFLLVCADHYASQMKGCCENLPRDIIPGKVFANLTEQRNDGETHMYWGDELEAHLKKTRKFVRDFHNSIGFGENLSDARRLKYQCKPVDDSLPEEVKKRFLWQTNISKKLTQDTTKKYHSLFILNVAETGSGKTKANMDMLSSLCPQPFRVTTLLGRRNLTEQTYKFYTDKLIGISTEDIAILLGQDYVLGKDVSHRYNGTESDEKIETDCISPMEGKSHSQSLMYNLASTEREKRYHETPCLVATLDQVALGFAIKRSNNIKRLSRLMTSHLVIDEVDNYSNDDWQLVVFLCYIAGLFGRHVIVSSATLTPSYAIFLYKSWKAGADCYHHIAPGKPGALVVSNRMDGQLVVVDEKDSLEHAWKRFTTKIFEPSHVVTPYHQKKDVLDIEGASTLHGIFEKLSVAAIKLHESHGFVSAREGGHLTKISVGVIRLNNIPTVQLLTQYLYSQQQPEGYQVIPICLHSKFRYIDRQVREIILEYITNRKNYIWLDHIYDWFPEIRTDARNIVIIVCATDILEVGRDYDFDWMIAEPCTYSSLLQLLGRLWRHRKHLQATKVNFLLLSSTIKHMICRKIPADAQKKWMTPWKYPGIRTDFDELNPDDLSNELLHQLLEEYMKDSLSSEGHPITMNDLFGLRSEVMDNRLLLQFPKVSTIPVMVVLEHLYECIKIQPEYYYQRKDNKMGKAHISHLLDFPLIAISQALQNAIILRRDYQYEEKSVFYNDQLFPDNEESLAFYSRKNHDLVNKMELRWASEYEGNWLRSDKVKQEISHRYGELLEEPEIVMKLTSLTQNGQEDENIYHFELGILGQRYSDYNQL